MCGGSLRLNTESREVLTIHNQLKLFNWIVCNKKCLHPYQMNVHKIINFGFPLTLLKKYHYLYKMIFVPARSSQNWLLLKISIIDRKPFIFWSTKLVDDHNDCESSRNYTNMKEIQTYYVIKTENDLSREWMSCQVTM